MTRTAIESEIAGLQQQEREHRILAERAAGAIQALQHVLSKMPAEPAVVAEFPVKAAWALGHDRLGEPAPV